MQPRQFYRQGHAQDDRRFCQFGANCRNRNNGRCQLRHDDDDEMEQNVRIQPNPPQQIQRRPNQPQHQHQNQQQNRQQMYQPNQRSCKFGNDCRDFHRGNCNFQHPAQAINPQPPPQKVNTSGIDIELKNKLTELSQKPIEKTDIVEYTKVFAQIDVMRCDLDCFSCLSKILRASFSLEREKQMPFLFDLHSTKILYSENFFKQTRNCVLKGNQGNREIISVEFLDSILVYYLKIIEIDRHACNSIPSEMVSIFYSSLTKKFLDGPLSLALTEDEKKAKILLENFPKKTAELCEKVQDLKERLKNSQNQAPPLKPNIIAQALQPELPEDPFFPKDYEVPEGDFRHKNLFFTLRDIENKNLGLRKIPLGFPYPDLETYLDIHFRLYLEDFYSSIKKGIRDYHKNIRENYKTKRVEGLYMYDGQVTEQVATRNGISLKLQIPISKNYRISQKRFIFGSMILLSRDDFKNFVICIARQTNFPLIDKKDDTPKFLEVLVEPKLFGKTTQTLMSEIRNRKLKVAESSSYFESYYHCLKNMQEMVKMPLEHLIVHCRAQDNKIPDYLCTVAYDAAGRPTKKIKDEVALVVREIMNTNNFDESQKRSVDLALNKELTIIQGPPGCGKTFVSVQIVKMLLKIKRLINGPIFIICYTNHALDQFLEHIMAHTANIVRLGGRCKNENLKQFTLQERRKAGTIVSSKEAGYYNAQRIKLEKRFNELSEIVVQGNAYQFLQSEEWVHQREKYFEEIVDRYRRLLNDFIRNLDKKKAKNFLFFYDKRTKPLKDFGLAIMFWLQLLDFEVIYTEFLKVEQEKDKNTKKAENNDQKEAADTNSDDEFEERARELFAEKELAEQQNNAPEIEKNDYFEIENEMVPFLNSKPTARFNHSAYKTVGEMIFGEKTRYFQSQNANQEIYEHYIGYEQDRHSNSDLNRRNLHEKWAINNFMVHEMVQKCELEMNQLSPEIETWTQKAIDAENGALSMSLKNADIIGVTTTGAAKLMSMLTKIQSQVALIEEAAEVLECQIVTSLTSTLTHLILIGDHKQLRPKVNDMDIAKKYNLEISLFERLVGLNFDRCQIVVQRRMRPEISQLIRLFYPELRDDPSVLNMPNIRGLKNDVYFFTHDWQEETHDVIMKESKTNKREATFIVKFAEFLMKNNYYSYEITILSLYSGQLLIIKSELAKNEALKNIRVVTVDDYQGEENKIILLSLVRSNNKNNIGFLKFDNRINVAFSRAKQGFYVFGNAKVIRSYYENKKTQNPDLLLFKIIKFMSEKNMLGTQLEIICQTHKNTVLVEKESDFQNSPNGGCKQPCNMRRQCGHQCKQFCHNFVVSDTDPDGHKLDPCLGECVRNHGCDHGCGKLCGSCKPEKFKCMKKITVKIDKCGHSFEINCNEKNLPENKSCKIPCNMKLRCGHPCYKKCYELCATVTPEQREKGFLTACTHNVDTDLPCGHTGKRPCGQDVGYFLKNYVCKARCDRNLDCEHPCAGRCDICRILVNGKYEFYHENCQKKCSRNLPCGHECRETCSDGNGCSPCTIGCYNKCKHSICPMRCGEICVGCIENCGYECPHKKCTKKCKEICDRAPCDERCSKKLKCGHQCIGLCGEDCPDLCRVCQPEHADFEIFFGDEDEPDAKFIQLNCKHSFVASGLDILLSAEAAKSKEISYPRCPKCRSPIYYCMRYQKEIKSVINKINLIKAQIMSNLKEKYNEVKHFKFDQEIVKYLKSSVHFKDVEKIVIERTKAIKKQSAEINSFLRVVEMLIFLGKVMKKIIKPDENSFVEQLLFKLRPKIFNWGISDQNSAILVNAIKTIEYIIDFDIMMKKAEQNDILGQFINEQKLFKNQIAKIRQIVEIQEGMFCNQYFPEFDALIENNRKFLDGNNIKETFKQISRIIGVPIGHWYVCSNGHPYTVDECGAPMELSRCPNCGVQIGGQNHALTQGNSHINIDGARPAYDPGNLLRNEQIARDLDRQINGIRPIGRRNNNRDDEF